MTDWHVDRDYKTALNAFEESLVVAHGLSRAIEGQRATEPVWWASVLFTRLCVTSLSLVSLVPQGVQPMSNVRKAIIATYADRYTGWAGPQHGAKKVGPSPKDLASD